MLEVDIQKACGSFHLNAAFSASSGETLGLLGASGCGKSVTLKCIAGILRPDRGRIVLNGRVLFDSAASIDLPPQARRVGYLFQSYALFPHMTVAQNIAAGLRSPRPRRETVDRLLASFRLTDVAAQYPRQLSGGQQQRTALARILASQPDALLLDEPFAALDDYLKWQVALELMDRLEDFPGPVLFVTHHRQEVRQHCQAVCVLDRGRTQPVQPVDALFSAPLTRSAFLLAGGKNCSRVEAGPDGLRAVDWGIPLPAAPRAAPYAALPNDALRPARGPGPCRIPCAVLRVVEEPSRAVLIAATPGGRQGASRLRVQLPKGGPAFRPGDTVWVEFDPEALLFLDP